MKQNTFLDKNRKRLSTVCVGPSTLRGQGGQILQVSRNYFYTISLNDFFKNLPHPDKFNRFLDKHTDALLQEFRKNGCNSFGAARKGLNLYFRDVVYNKFISDYYNLPKDLNDLNDTIKHLEVPLDSFVGNGIYNNAESLVPKWKTIIGLTKAQSDIFQNAALTIAKRNKISRVHLDLLFWNQ